MSQVSDSHLADSERAELETVLAALERNPRLANLLRFLAEKYFQGRTAEINEYNIATEVFGRSKASFDGTTDSIARVETHRLRRKLKEYYDNEGQDHKVLIALPYRSYIPEFNRRPNPADGPEPAQLGHSPNPVDLFPAEGIPLPGPKKSEGTAPKEIKGRWMRVLLFAVAGVLGLLLVIFAATRFFGRTSSEGTASTHPPNLSESPKSPNVAHVPLHLLAGYQGTPRIDSAGVYWEADRYFGGSGGFRRPDPPPAKTSDPMLFDYWRIGDFSYDIPLTPGPYELHLFFVASPQDDPNTTFFDVSANGHTLLSAFNISSDALGANIADERVFKDIYPNKDGFLHLKFSTGRSGPTLNALEILPGLPHKQLPVRVVTQRAAVTDHGGNIWHPDTYFQGGTLSTPPRQVSDTPDPGLYSQERYGHFTYSIPADTRGRYTLVLHFAELYWVPDSSGSVGVGSRVFQVYCNGSTLLDHFDIFKEAGSLHALTKTFHHLQPSPEGKLDLTFEPITNYATVSAIEVIDESE